MKSNNYKEMKKVEKKLNTLDYVFFAMIKDLEKMKNENRNTEFIKLRLRLTELFNNDIKNTKDEYMRLLDVVYGGTLTPA
jgi:hypothetical protein